MVVSSATAESITLAFWMASPRPMLSTTLSRRGTWFTLRYPISFMRCGTTSLRYLSRRRAMASPIQLVAATAAHAHAAPVLEHALAHAHRGVALVAHDHEVGEVERGFLLDDARRRLRAARLLMPLDQVEPFDQRPLLGRHHAQDPAGLAALAAGDDHDVVVLLDARAHGLRAPRVPGRGSS